MHQWLVKWDDLNLNQTIRHGRLSNETIFALKHTVATFTELIKFLFVEIRVLTGEFQTDSYMQLQYRQLSDANLTLMCVQELKESEQKLEIVSLLLVISAKKGKIFIEDFVLKSPAAEDAENSLRD